MNKLLISLQNLREAVKKKEQEYLVWDDLEYGLRGRDPTEIKVQTSGGWTLADVVVRKEETRNELVYLQTEYSQLVKRLLDNLDSLDSLEYEAMVLTYIDNLDMKEVCYRMDKSRASVYRYLSSARDKMRHFETE